MVWRITFTAVASVLAGFLIGLVTASYWHERGVMARLDQPTWTKPSTSHALPEKAATADSGPVVMVDQEEFDFGTMEFGGQKTHTFRITNGGQAELQLNDGGTTCSCTVSDFDNATVAPGESIDIKITWVAKHASHEFSHTATVLTNDPRRPRVHLSVVGTVVQQVSLDPPALVFSGLATGGRANAKIDLLSARRDDVQILSHRIADDSLAKFFEIATEPLAADEIVARKAKGAVRVLVTVLPGLPEGRFSTQLDLTTNLSEHDIQVPVTGIVYGDVTIVGQGWDPGSRTLMFGEIPRGSETRRHMSVMLRGAELDSMVVQMKSVTPALLRVKMGERTTVAQQGMAIVPLEVIASADGFTADELALAVETGGEIVLLTNHPNVPEVRFNVKFTVAP